MIDKIYYLACPYTGPDKSVEEARFHAANRTAARLIAEGHFVFSPVSHFHPIAIDAKLSGGWDFWQKYCEMSLHWCNRLIVLKLNGWETSTGVQAEISLAKELGYEIEYIDYV
jgi:hypothetical protein